MTQATRPIALEVSPARLSPRGRRPAPHGNFMSCNVFAFWIAVLVAASILAVAPAPAVAGAEVQAALQAYAGDPAYEDLGFLAERALEQGADPELLPALVTAAGAAGLPASDLSLVLNQTISIAARDLPTRPVLSRYLQGLARGIAFPRVRAAADQVETRLESAARFLNQEYPEAGTWDPVDRDAILDHLAYALGVGVEPGFLTRSVDLVRNARPTRDDAGEVEEIRAPVMALSFLVSAGVENPRSYELVSMAWGQGYRGADLERLGETVVRLGQNGHAGEVVDQVMLLLDRDLAPDDVFHNLENMKADPVDGSLPGPLVPGSVPRNGGKVPGERPDNGNRGIWDQQPGNGRGSGGR